MAETQLLLPNETDAREMEVFSSIPEHDQQAWLHFVHDSHAKESLGIGPAYTFDQFEDGIAPVLPGMMPVVDGIVEQGFNNRPLIDNFREPVEVQTDTDTVTIDPLLGAFDASKHVVERELERGPLALLVPHSSLASPYLTARSFLHTHPELADKLHIVIGPRPAVMQFEVFDKATEKQVDISPVMIGRALANLVLTGPDTDSTRNKNPELDAWLKQLRKNFWGAMEHIVEPQNDGIHNVVIFCPAGRVAERQRTGRIQEYRVDGSFSYLTKHPGAPSSKKRRLSTGDYPEHTLRVLPVGVHDSLLIDPKAPETTVVINPDANAWLATSEDHAQYLHERAVILANHPAGGISIENSSAQSRRLARQHIRRYVGKSAKAPYLIN